MQIDVMHSLLVIAVCVACTWLERALPFLLFRGRTVPKVIEYLGRVLPLAIMTTLVVYCVKGISFVSLGNWLPSLAGIALTAALQYWLKNTLVSIAGGTVLYMLLVQLVFV